MIKDNQRLFNQLQVLIDAVVIVISYILAYFVRFAALWYDERIYHLPLNSYCTILFFAVPMDLFLYYHLDLYSSRRMSGRKRELFAIIQANTVGLLLIIVMLYMVHMNHISRGVIFIFWGFNIFLETFTRNVIRYILRLIRKKGFNLKYVLLVGYSKSAEAYINRIRLNPQWGYVVRGILDNQMEAGTMYKGVKVLGRIENLEIILPENKLDEIAITLSLDQYKELESVVSLCEKSGVHTKFIPDYNRFIPNRAYMEDLQGLPVINIRHVPLSNTMNMIAKRIEDIIVALLMLIVFSPVMLIAAVAVKLSSPGPIIFSQERVGLHNKPFKMYKFRSMVVQTPDDEAEMWTTKGDSRVTAVGRLLRQTSMDELPQLFNIIKGDMSIVGPRPERPQFVEKFQEEIPRYNIKHQVRPGLTGWAQVNGLRGDTSIEERIEYDIYYIENWTMGFDFKIIFMTAIKGIINENAY